MFVHYINDIRDLIGHTPLLKLNHIFPHENIHIYGKLEYLNPGGSIKDRIGLQILEDAERAGLLKPGATIIEATAGNTGIGLAMAAFEKGYKLQLVIPQKFSIEKQILMRALGAELIITPSEDGIEGAMAKAEELYLSTANAFLARQFENISNINAHRKTGAEIYNDLDGKIDILVAGAGSGGTIMGIAAYLREKNPNIKIVLSDPEGSILGGGHSGTYHIEGIGNHFIPTIFDSSFIQEVEKITDDEASYYVQLLSRKEGVLAGPSSGAALAGAIKQAYKAKADGKPINIVAIFPDRSERYFSDNIYNFNMELSDLRFNDLFNIWSNDYDQTVTQTDGEYVEVFKNYDHILEETVNQISLAKDALVVDIGSGTGNLAHMAFQKGYTAIGLEPNEKMRNLSSMKYPHIPVKAGSFLTLPLEARSIDAIVSSYAFHHLSDYEKGDAIRLMASKLRPQGKIIIADTMYASPEASHALLEEALNKNALHLVEDLKSEFYTTHEVLRNLFEANGFHVSFKSMNKFVWILTATLK